MTPDIDKYRRCVDRFDLTEDQKVELIHTVWRIVEGFAYRAFGQDPVQQVLGSNGRKDASKESPMLDFEKVTNPENPLTDTFRLKTPHRGRRKK